MAKTDSYANSWPARGHDNLALHASAAAAYAAGILYKGIYFNADCNLDVVDAKQNMETVKGLKGCVYPVQNYGVVTDGGTTGAQGDFLMLFD